MIIHEINMTLWCCICNFIKKKYTCHFIYFAKFSNHIVGVSVLFFKLFYLVKIIYTGNKFRCRVIHVMNTKSLTLKIGEENTIRGDTDDLGTGSRRWHGRVGGKKGTPFLVGV